MQKKLICGLLISPFLFSLAGFPPSASAQEEKEIREQSLGSIELVDELNLLQPATIRLSSPNAEYGIQSSALMIDGNGNNRMVFHSYAPANQPLVDYLASPKVQEQIDLSSEQKNQFTAIRKKLQEGYAELNKRYHQRTDVKASKKIREEMTQEFQKKIKKLRLELEEEVKETLVPHQVNLIQRMKFKKAVQIFGFTHAVSNAPFNEEIKTTEEQKKKLAKIKMETEKAIQEKIAEMRIAGKEKMLKALDTNQRKKIKELEGESEKKSSPKL